MYLERCLAALERCDGFNELDHIVVGIDDSQALGRACYEMLVAWSSRLAWPKITFIPQSRRRGIDASIGVTHKAAYDLGVDAVFGLEDDGVLRLDALRLARWFVEQKFEKYGAMGLSACGDPRPGNNDPATISQYNYIPCTNAYVIMRPKMRLFLESWSSKVREPYGWDWSISYYSIQNNLLFLGPRLSRVENIGRENGEHETHETFDRTRVGFPLSDGSYRGPYTLEDDHLVAKDGGWMTAEKLQIGAPQDQWGGCGRPPELGSIGD
jgi:hypothetical protein